MPRTRRFIPINSALYIMCRGNNKQNVFNNDNDKLYYWHTLKELKEKNKINIFHYCIMDNHVHLIVWISCVSNLPKFMKQLSLLYFNYYKKRYGYWGHICQGRYKNNVIETAGYLLHCGKYIELNPVRAGIVNLPQDYIFSSYKYYSFGHPDDLISENPVFLGLADNYLERQKQYIKFVINNDMINKDRLVRQTFIGSNDFVSKLRQYYNIKETNSKGGRPKKSKT
ncbi:MAG: transposase [Candidatus Omnitrophota bacterium]